MDGFPVLGHIFPALEIIVPKGFLFHTSSIKPSISVPNYFLYSLDYHICTGHKPADNVFVVMSQIGHPNPGNVSTAKEWLKEGYGTGEW